MFEYNSPYLDTLPRSSSKRNCFRWGREERHERHSSNDLPFRNRGLWLSGVESKPLIVAAREDWELIRPTAGGTVNVVIINSTGRQAFHQLLPANAVPEMAVGEEVEWFADVAESIIGTIGIGGMNMGWNYAILNRDPSGDFRVSERRRNFSTRHTARVTLLRRMVGAEVAEAWRLAA